MAETWLTVEAAALLTYLRVALFCFPPGVVRRSLRVVESHLVRRPYSPETVVRAVERAAGRLKALDNCLAKALAARVLLARSGHTAQLRIGMLPDSTRLMAHAWLERDGVVILGGAESSVKYAPFPELEHVLA